MSYIRNSFKKAFRLSNGGGKEKSSEKAPENFHTPLPPQKKIKILIIFNQKIFVSPPPPYPLKILSRPTPHKKSKPP